MPVTRAGEAGFTVVETLIATAMVGMLAVGAGELMLQQRRSIATASNKASQLGLQNEIRQALLTQPSCTAALANGLQIQNFNASQEVNVQLPGGPLISSATGDYPQFGTKVKHLTLGNFEMLRQLGVGGPYLIMSDLAMESAPRRMQGELGMDYATSWLGKVLLVVDPATRTATSCYPRTDAGAYFMLPTLDCAGVGAGAGAGAPCQISPTPAGAACAPGTFLVGFDDMGGNAKCAAPKPSPYPIPSPYAVYGP